MMHEDAPGKKPVWEKPGIAHTLKAVALVLAVLVVLAWTGHITLVPRVRALCILGALAAIVMGWRALREGITAVQSTILLAVVYVIGIGVAALFLRLLRRDLLDLRTSKASLWHRRPALSPDELAETLKRQF